MAGAHGARLEPVGKWAILRTSAQLVWAGGGEREARVVSKEGSNEPIWASVMHLRAAALAAATAKT